jgi:hypothetical protein
MPENETLLTQDTAELTVENTSAVIEEDEVIDQESSSISLRKRKVPEVQSNSRVRARVTKPKFQAAQMYNVKP